MSDAADRPELTAFRALLPVLGGFLVLGVLGILARRPDAGAAAVALVCLAGASGLQLVCAARELRERFGTLVLAPQTLLALLPPVVSGFSWPGMFGFLAGSLMLALGPLPGLVVVGGACATGALLRLDWRDWAFDGAATAAVGLALYGTTRLAELVVRARAAREPFAWRAVAQERNRFARDLHDLLGYSLSAIALKTDLAHRLVRSEPDRALAELDSARDVAQQALGDVRAVARGHRELSFAVEAESARSLLAAADIRASVDVRCAVPDPVGTVLATVLREGVTNVIRHSKATECRIEVRDRGDGFIRFTLSNDGVRKSSGRSCQGGGGGGGLGNLAERLAAVGGRLVVGTDERGWYRVVAEAPSAPAAVQEM
ncbi:histidine kinase [Streptomyces sp. S.PB5]|uniref:sensor histidine kinase n=1 Tax=Streptomyces sp. S.PB5 TaxID=3020844 RepID=UPI0025B20668|nr:histidine kinase [Streptomyces sp. S.PB5]MDN3022233.1 histidine kinase [Streptomyces sp. S.PB5]